MSLPTDIFFEIHKDLPREGPGRNQYTQMAFQMIPKLEKPRILDIGCGPGAPTLELVRLSGGKVIGVDIHQPYLDQLKKKIHESGLQDRVQVINRSMFELDFPEQSFDIVWSEGAIFVIGFERGLKEWRWLIKPSGFLVVHEVTWLQPNPPQEILDYWKREYPGISDIPQKISQIIACGYELVGHFPLPEDAWWIEYYRPLEKRIQTLRKKFFSDSNAMAVLDQQQQEI